MLQNNLKTLPANLLAKAGELTRDEIAELLEKDIDVSRWDIGTAMREAEDAFRTAIKLLEYRGIKKKTWKDLEAGIITAFLITIYEATYSALDPTGKLKPLPDVFKDFSHGLTGGEKFELFDQFGVMSLENTPSVADAYGFVVSKRKMGDIDLETLPLYGRDLFIGYVTMGNFPVQKDFMMNLKPI